MVWYELWPTWRLVTLPALIIIAIVADDDLRHSWILSRKRADDSQSLDKILARDEREIEFGLKDVITNANYIIKNESDVQELKDKCQNLMKELIK